jgi:hypothetical protein
MHFDRGFAQRELTESVFSVLCILSDIIADKMYFSINYDELNFSYLKESNSCLIVESILADK